MPTARDFRRIVLGLPDAIEGAHMGHADFRLQGRIFATLNREETRGMVVLTPDQQRRFVADHPAAFQPENGAWGRSGCTRVDFASVDDETLGEAATLAWQNSRAKGPSPSRRKSAAKRTSSPRRRESTKKK
jgi:hypothetical protein